MTGKVIWIMGLPGAGKTTLAKGLASRWRGPESVPVRPGGPYLLDGDALRATPISENEDYSDAGRERHLRRAAWIAGEVARLGHNVAAAFVTPTNRLQDVVRATVGDDLFRLVYLDTPKRFCAQRRKLWPMTFEPPDDGAIRLDGTKPTRDLVRDLWGALYA